MDTKEIISCALQIEKFSADKSYGNMLTLLGDLDESHVTAEQLETTDIVKILYRIKKNCSDDNVKKTVRSLLSKWKRHYSSDTQGAKCTDGRKDAEVSCGVSLQHTSKDGGLSKQEHSRCSSAKPSDSTTESVNATSASSGLSSVRNKCVQLLHAALCPKTPDQDKASDLAGDIEKHLHELHRSNQVKYKACVRSKVANLKNPKNGHLRQGLLSGSLSPGTFARMSFEEMACAELQHLREEYSSHGVSERQLPQGVEGMQTQKIRCKRCEGSDCRVTQVSRGALFLPAWVRRAGPDEDAMTFVTCSSCGEQWYHSGWVCL